MKKTLVVLAVVAGSLGIAPAASAACVGTAATVVVCVNPTGGTLYTDCVYVVNPPCIPVTVPGPTLACGGAIGERLISCM